MYLEARNHQHPVNSIGRAWGLEFKQSLISGEDEFVMRIRDLMCHTVPALDIATGNFVSYENCKLAVKDPTVKMYRWHSLVSYSVELLWALPLQ